ncbi:two-component system response regulator KdpE [Methyloversatilis thermotolerans]|uniref:two-component system response regulator KdpE n=1 Tax=Methyloversatilis thermotolerans TaxID=1346290 RepID=UPI00036193FB|nr:two-component system response regulator KdpE [Methyloversatilis thermotolerans]
MNDSASAASAHILIVEDDPGIRRFVRQALEDAGHSVSDADRLQRGLIDAATRKPDLLIVDLGLPDGDGLDLIRELRGWNTQPVIVLSARSGEADKIAALDAGADDYLAKPFSVGELLARVRAALRRATGGHDGTPVIRFGACCFDRARRLLTRDGEPVHLTPVEYRLLALLAAHEGQVLTQRQLLLQVWGPNSVEHAHYLRIYMGHLRRKLEQDASRPRHLLTETGVGYRFVAEPLN